MVFMEFTFFIRKRMKCPPDDTLQQPGPVPMPMPLQEPVYDICMQPYDPRLPYVKSGYDTRVPYIDTQSMSGETHKTYETHPAYAGNNDYTHMWTTGQPSTASTEMN